MQELERKLGLMEAYFAYKHKFAGTSVMRRMFMISGRITPRAVRAAVSALRDRHPMLDARIIATPSGLYFVRDNKNREDPIEIHTWDKEQNPDKFYDTTHSLSFPDNGLLYRFIFLLGNHGKNIGIIVTHHAIADVLCMNELSKETVVYLNEFMEDGLITTRESYDFPANVEHEIVEKRSKRNFFKSYAKTMLRSIIISTMPHEEKPSMELRYARKKTKDIFLVLSKNQTNQIYKFVEDKSYGIYSILSSCILLAQIRTMNESNRSTKNSLLLSMPINCRVRGSGDEEKLCVRINGVVHRIPVSERDNVDGAAVVIKSVIDRSLEKPGEGLCYDYCDFILKKTMKWKARANTTFTGGVGLTFLGHNNSVTMSKLRFNPISQGTTADDGDVVVNAGAYLTDGRLKMYISYGVPFLGDETARRLVELFVEALPVEGEVLRTQSPAQMARYLGLLSP